MAYEYELYSNPFDKVDDILGTYRKKIAVLKCDIQCRQGTFLQNSIVYIEIDKTKIVNNKAEIELKIHDCSEKVQDIYTINADSNDELSGILDSLFAVDEGKTRYYREYSLFEWQINEYQKQKETAYDIIQGLFKGISVAIWLFFVIIAMLAFKEWDITILTTPTCMNATAICVCILIGMMILIPITKNIIERIFSKKISPLQKFSNDVYAKITEE